MTPQAIAQLKTQSPILQEALKTEPKLWHFLREGVTICEPAAFCAKCAHAATPSLETPYNGPYGWCINCVLQTFMSAEDAPIEYYDPYRDLKSPKYDAVYDSSCKSAVFCWVSDDDEHPEMA